MAGIVVTGHGNFATGLKCGLKLIYGRIIEKILCRREDGEQDSNR